MTDQFDRIEQVLDGMEELLRVQAYNVVAGLQVAGIAQARQNLIDAGAVDTQQTLNSITALPIRETEDGWAGEVRATAPQAVFIEHGRSAGGSLPPGGALLGWLGRHAIPLRAEFAIRRAISQRGIPPKPFIETLGEQLAGVEQQLMAQASSAVRATLTGSEL